MIQIPDDPILRCMERTGYPPWMDPDWEDDEEHGFDSYRDEEPFADYDPD